MSVALDIFNHVHVTAKSVIEAFKQIDVLSFYYDPDLRGLAKGQFSADGVIQLQLDIHEWNKCDHKLVFVWLDEGDDGGRQFDVVDIYGGYPESASLVLLFDMFEKHACARRFECAALVANYLGTYHAPPGYIHEEINPDEDLE